MKHANRFSMLWLFVGLVLALAIVAEPALAQVGAQVPLNPRAIPQFVDQLPHFAYPGSRLDAKTATDVYVAAVAHTQVAVSTGTKLAGGLIAGPGVGAANLWVYQVSTDGVTWKGPLWPAFTIETTRGNPLNVHYSTNLAGEKYSNVGLVVDPTLHWADPIGNMMTYDGEPPITVHLHGGEVPPLSDGGPDSWFTSTGAKGHAYNPDPYFYPNTQEAATLWFHDHALGVTRLNVYAGMAGFYFLRGGAAEDGLKLPGWSGDGTVQEVDPVTGVAGVSYLPEIEVVIQDRMFDTNGGLYFPNLPTNPGVHPSWTPEFVGDVITVNGKTWPYLSVAPRTYRFRLLNGSNARFYNLSFPKGGPTITQIGTDGGFLDVPVALGNGPLLLAPGERADVIIDFTPFAPVANKKGKPKISSFVLGNDARTPFPGGATVNGATTGRIMQFVVNGNMSGTTPATVPNTALRSPMVKLTNFAGARNPDIPAIAKTRQLTLNEVMGPGGPLEVLVNNTKYSGLSLGATVRSEFTRVPNGTGDDPLKDFTYYSETVDEGTTEIWQIINMTADAHPMHLHLVQFQLMSRQPFNVKGYTAVYDAAFPGGLFLGGYGPPVVPYTAPNLDGAIGGNPAISPFLTPGAVRGANLNEQGWKDTFIMYPGEVTTVIARWAPTTEPATKAAQDLWFPDFNPNGGHGYVWHCHIIDHEDNEMMRPYNVNPNLFAGARFGDPTPLAGTLAELELDELSIEEPVGQNLPTVFGLSQNYPNPFNPSTEIRFSLPDAAHVTMKVYNSVGQEVTTLIDSDAPAGYHTVKVDGRGLSSGIYYYRIQAGNFTDVKSMILLK